MKWGGLNLHLENLLPGIVSLVLIYALLPQQVVDILASDRIKEIIKPEFISAGVFVASAYMLGVLIAAISRLALDKPSELLLRPRLLRLLYRESLSGKSVKQVNKEYRRQIRAVQESNNETVKSNVSKRREQGRLARTSVVPTLLAVLLLTSNLTLCARMLSLVVTIILALFVYAYIETTIYEECLLLKETA